jgi:hypothetical protein
MEDQPKEAMPSELMADALAHYRKLSTEAGEWNSGIENAIVAYYDGAMDQRPITKIRQFDKSMHQSVEDLLDHIYVTYVDKYAGKVMFDTKDLIYSPEHGKAVNLFNAAKYIERYAQTNFLKANNPNDLLKAIHYLLFEYDRRKRAERVVGTITIPMDEELPEGNEDNVEIYCSR